MSLICRVGTNDATYGDLDTDITMSCRPNMLGIYRVTTNNATYGAPETDVIIIMLRHVVRHVADVLLTCRVFPISELQNDMSSHDIADSDWNSMKDLLQYSLNDASRIIRCHDMSPCLGIGEQV